VGIPQAELMQCTNDILGPTHLLFSLTYEYAPCIPFKVQTSGGTEGDDCAAARMTSAMTIVADREIPHWQLKRTLDKAQTNNQKHTVREHLLHAQALHR
jgi:hypothetical protein